ncbi:hypothetical protein M758_2G219700 [Ceratodon purpureus]|nr:hypothetical protein M758_2G219700 [Ceratodon purpureus]
MQLDATWLINSVIIFMKRLAETSTPTCYLEVFFFSSTLVETGPPPGSIISHRSFPWTQPCPRKSLPNGNCTFAFTQDGDIQLLNNVAGRSNLVWNSNTTGLGATTLDVRDDDTVNYEYEYDGNLVLKNSSGHIVWENGRNDTNYGCGDPSWGSAASHAAAAKRASVINLICLALISFAGAALMLWDSGTARPGRDQLLIVGFVACCLLLPSSSESKPIQAGFTTNLWQNFTLNEGQFDISTSLVESPTNRTSLLFHVAATEKWGATCYISVGADRQSTDIVLNASAPGPAAPSSNVNTVEYVPWSAPCPRKLLPAFVNCTFTFTTSGDIQVHNYNVGAGTSELLWSSNTAGLGVTSLDMLDSDPSGSGSMVLYNNRSEVVWRNILNATDQNFQCSTPTSGAALRMSIASSSLAVLVLSSSFLLRLPAF